MIGKEIFKKAITKLKLAEILYSETKIGLPEEKKNIFV